MPLLLLSVILNCVLLLSGCGLNGGTHRVARGTEVPPPETTDVTYTGGVDAFRRTVYVITRRDCIGCHRNSTFLPNHASDDLEGTAYPIAKTKVDFNNIPNSLFVRQIMNGHCGNPAICQKDGTEMIAAITAWKAVEVAAVPGDLKISICQDQSSIGASNQRLLSKVAYTNTLRDLYGASVVTSVADTLGQVPDEHAGFGTFTSQGMSISSRHVEAYFNIAEKIAGLVSASTTSRASIQSCLASSTTSLSERLTCVDTFLNDHAQKAYRRPLNPTEKSELKNLYVAGEPRGHAEGVKLLLWGMLQARPFLYLFE